MLQAKLQAVWKLFMILSCFSVLQFTFIEQAHAEERNELVCTLKRIADTLTGNMGKLIATIAVVALGIGLFLGKLSWGLAVATAIGIAMIFGASSIVDWLAGGSGAFGGTQFNCP